MKRYIRRNLVLIIDPQIKQEQIDRLNSLAEFLLGNGTISESVDAKSVINNDYYEAASKTFTK